MLRYLLEKEFKQLVRNSFLPRLILFMPCMVMLILPWAASMEVNNINLCIVDSDRSPLAARLAQKAASSAYFRLVDVQSSYERAMEGIESGRTDMILEIPDGFESDLFREGGSRVLISANAVNGTKGGLGSSYLSAIVNGFAAEVRSETGGGASGPAIEIVPRNLFNPTMNYKLFMVPALMVMLLTLICGFLPALNVVGEKEAGTIEQINVTPVGKFQFIIAKLIPYWLIGFLVLTICFALARLIYGIAPAGSLLTVYIGAILFVLAVSGFGLVISNYSGTMQQAMFVMYFFLIVLILMSGLFTPVSSMPGWARTITTINPLKYFIQVMRLVYLKGSTISDLLPQFAALGGFALALNTWAVLSYRKSA